jgi:hypothetical protein
MMGLSKDELVIFKEAVLEYSALSGLPGEAIFSGLMEGKPVHETLGLNDQAIETLYGLAYQHLSAGHLQKAERLFGVLTLLKPTVRHYWLGLAMVARASKKPNMMMDALAIVEKLSPDWAILHYHLLEIHCEEKDWTKAKRDLAAFKKANQDGVSTYMQRQIDRYSLALESKR